MNIRISSLPAVVEAAISQALHSRSCATNCQVAKNCAPSLLNPQLVQPSQRVYLLFDYGDTAKMAPIAKMYTLGHDFVPEGIHAGD